MALYIRVHPENPQPRLINQIASLLQKGGVIIYPTDTGYSLGCQIGDKDALNRIRQIRQLDKKHHFTLACHNLSELGTYAIVSNSAYRLLKLHTPGAYTFILRATKEVPRRLQHPKRKTIGFKVPDNKIALAIMEAKGAPIMNTSLLLPGQSDILTDPEDIRDRYDKLVDMIVDGGYCGNESSTVVDLTTENPQLVRHGAGEMEELQG